VTVGSLVSVGAERDATPALERTVDAVSRIVPPRSQAAPKVVWDSPARDQYGPRRTTICHKSRTIIVDENAVAAHVRHGDRPGGCPSGAAGLGAGRGQGSGKGRMPAASSVTPGSGTLPSTGFSLGTTAVLGLMLVALGLAFRRKGRSVEVDE
jgi:LPXTG-motif cell wall-anchored protein